MLNFIQKIRNINLNILELRFFQIFLFILPFQLRYIFVSIFPPEPVSVIKITREFNEWTSIFVYFSDIIFVFILFLWLLRCYRDRSRAISDYWPVIFLVCATLSFYQADNLSIALFRFLKLSEAVLLFYYARDFIKEFGLKNIIKPICTALIIQGLISFLQIILQHNIGLWFLGEGNFYPGLRSVAAFRIGEGLFLRAYGTFQHPNVLAFFAFGSLGIVYKYFLTDSRSARLAVVAIIFAHIIIFLSFSRTVALMDIGLHIFILCYYSLFKDKKLLDIFKYFIATFIVFIILFYPQFESRLKIDFNEEAYRDRVLLNQSARGVAQKNHNFGVGIGHSVYESIKNNPYQNPYLYQPAHNLFILIWSELGYIGIVIFLIFCINILIGLQTPPISVVAPYPILRLTFLGGILILGLFDHYQWTLHQGMLFFWLFLALL